MMEIMVVSRECRLWSTQYSGLSQIVVLVARFQPSTNLAVEQFRTFQATATAGPFYQCFEGHLNFYAVLKPEI